MSYTIFSYHDPKSLKAEAFRTLRTNLQFTSPDKPVRSIVITSATPGEGKSTVAANLAVSFAQTGKKTLLVDADLRRPTIDKFFGLDSSYGLSNLFVAGSELNELDALVSSVDNLFVLTSGPVPPNPAELLSSQRGKSLFKGFEEQYDIVLIDSPPVAAVSDSLILSTYAGGTLLVIRYGKVAKEVVRKSLTQLENVKANVLGAVLNQIPVGQRYYKD